jgi:hypothetical protein
VKKEKTHDSSQQITITFWTDARAHEQAVSLKVKDRSLPVEILFPPRHRLSFLFETLHSSESLTMALSDSMLPSRQALEDGLFTLIEDNSSQISLNFDDPMTRTETRTAVDK